jgi:hypothetical protein
VKPLSGALQLPEPAGEVVAGLRPHGVLGVFRWLVSAASFQRHGSAEVSHGLRRYIPVEYLELTINNLSVTFAASTTRAQTSTISSQGWRPFPSQLGSDPKTSC